MKINKIQKLKNNKYKISIDGENIITYDNVILENNLLYKNIIDDNLYNIIINSTEYYDIYNKVVKYILKKRRSEKEIRQYLLKFNLTDNEAEKIIIKLKNNNLINDIEYCRAFINDNIYLSKNGINKIKKDLISQGISNNIIDSELDNIDKELISNKLKKQVIKKINLNKKYSNSYLRQKILNELLNLGYEKDDILIEIDNNLNNNDFNILRVEFEKNYLKLLKKYKGYDLMQKLRINLLNKGFDINQIEQLLEEKTEK